MKKAKAGVSTDMPFEDYLQIEAISRSDLLAYDADPVAYGHGLRMPAPTGAMNKGSLFDTYILTPDRMDENYYTVPETYIDLPEKFEVAPDGWSRRSKEAKAWEAALNSRGITVLTKAEHEKRKDPRPWNRNATYCKEYEEEASEGGKIGLTSDQIAEAEAARQRADEHPLVREILGRSDKQVACVWEHEASNGHRFMLKALVDIIDPSGVAYDYKTTSSVTEKGWLRSILAWRYHIQAAMYMDGILKCDMDCEKFGHIPQLSGAPYTIPAEIPMMGHDFIELGRMEYTTILDKMAVDIERKSWEPSYGWREVHLPPWMEKDGTDDAGDE